MSSETQASTPTSAPSSTLSYWNALGLLWGAVMLTLYAMWLQKFLPLIPLNPEVKPVAPPATWVIVVTWILCGFTYLLWGWYTASLRMQILRPDLAAQVRLHQRLGVLLIVLGLALSAVGLYLVFTLRWDGFAESVGLCLFSLIPLLTGLVLQRSPGSGDLVSFALPRAALLQRALLALGGAGIVVFLWLAFGKRLGMNWLPELGAVVFESLLLITCGMWLTTSKPEEHTPLAMRFLLLILGGVTGLILTLEAFFRTVYWRQNVLLGGLNGWNGHSSWEFWLCCYVGLVGLALIFGTMLLARSEIRNQPLLRRVYFGYNAVASGLLLVAFLAAFNVLIYATYPLTAEWSQRGLISLADSTKTTLAALKNRPPVTVYVLLSQNSTAYKDMKNLLDNCQAEAPPDKFIVKYVAPEVDSSLYYELAERFPEVRPPVTIATIDQSTKEARARGLLVVSGPLPTDPKAPAPLYAFISDRKISETKFSQEERGQPKRVFMGEVELMRELNFLMRDKKPPKIYVLQGNGEMGTNRRDSNDRGGIGLLVDRLEKDNYKVKAIDFGLPGKDKSEPRSDVKFIEAEGPDKQKNVPEDASVLLVIGPTRQIPKETMDALDRYMVRGGRMMVALTLAPSKDRSELLMSGIEDFLQRFGVSCDLRRPNEGFVFRVPPPGGDIEDIFEILATPPEKSSNEFAKKFFGKGFELTLVRAVRSSDSPKFKTEVLLQADKDVGRDRRPYAVDNNIKLLTLLNFRAKYLDSKDPKKLPEVDRHIEEDPVPVAVAVSEEKPGVASLPRMVVFGTSSFVNNRNMFLGPALRDNYPLLVGTLEWMSDRPVSGVTPRESQFFTLPVEARVDRMVWGPLWLMTLSVLGLATGVWLVRRR